jgi:hypothetical protein
MKTRRKLPKERKRWLALVRSKEKKAFKIFLMKEAR